MTKREATWQERATWGECEVCGASHGQPCNPDKGLNIFRNVQGMPSPEGVHLSRLRNAPVYVQLVAAR